MNVEKAQAKIIAAKGEINACIKVMMKAQGLLDEAFKLMNEVLEDAELEEAGIISSNTRTLEIHDLRKDPTDLPKNGGHYLAWNSYGQYVLPYYNGFNCLENYRKTEITDIIAWAEIPKIIGEEL